MNESCPTSSIESQILGDLVNSPDKIPLYIYLLKPEDFADSANRMYFEIIQQRFKDGLLIDVGEMLIPCTQKGIPGQPTKCFDQFYEVPLFDLEQKVSTIKRESLKRYTQKELTKTLKDIKEGHLDVPDALPVRLADIAKSVMTRTPETNKRNISRLVRDALNNASRQQSDLIKFGISNIDLMLKGIEPGEMVTIAARTGIGKSALALDPLLNTGISGRWAILISTEMTTEQMALRAVSKLSGVATSIIKAEDGKYPTGDQTHMITDAVATIDLCKMSFRDDIRTIGQIEAEIQKQKHLGNSIRLVVVDYIQQLVADNSRSSRQEELSEISNRLMSLALREGLTVIVCAQLSRLSDPYGIPELSHIKDCGSIEQDSSRVIALTKDRSDQTLTHFHLLKNRPGKLGKTDLTFYGSNMRFFPKNNT